MTYPHNEYDAENNNWGCTGEEWLNTEIKKSEYSEPLPDGIYQAVIIKGSIKQARETKENYLSCNLYIISPLQHKGRYIFKSWFFGAKSRRFTKTDFEMMKININHPSELASEAGLRQFIGIVVEVNLKTSTYNGKASQNVWINRYIKQMTETEIEKTMMDDVIPF